MEKYCHEVFRKLNESRLYTRPDMLFGNLAGALGDKTKAIKKFENFKNYKEIYPEYKFIFIGDNGQGDALAGSLMKKEVKDDIEIFIHQVKDKGLSSGYTKEWESKLGIIFFLNYIDAAFQATKKGLIHPKGLRRVVVSAKHDFLDTVPVSFPQFNVRLQELNESIAKANELLLESQLEDVDLLSTESMSNL